MPLDPEATSVRSSDGVISTYVPRAGRTVRGYQLGERLGEGAFTIVHRAVQASLGREVAIKQIRSSLADRPEFIQQFEAEAHLVARLEHPHIVPLYDFWREPGSAYLVMRQLDGGTIADRLVDAPLDPSAVGRYMTHVAAALDEAHRAGVVHRDVKPANILLDALGNAFLSDFGIAVEAAGRLDPAAWMSYGSPAYAAPEQLDGEPVGPSADVFSLGITTYEALTGQLPFPEETTMEGLVRRQRLDVVPLVRSVRPEMSAAVDAVLQRATAKHPTDRYPSAGAFAVDLAAAVGLAGDEPSVAPQDRNPYKGLRAFDEADAADFAGREALVAKLVAAVDRHAVTAVVGPSGSGKSSVVRAGVLPVLRNGTSAGAEGWYVTTMIPGADPFADLEAALLRIAVEPPDDLAGRLRERNGLARALATIVGHDRRLLLVIDQFEELFTLADQDEARRFLDALADAAIDAPSLRTVLTIRADFYDHPLRHDAFARLIEDSTIAVHPLAADELERAIVEPAASVGASFEAGLVARITADVADQPGALPLLQYALTELFDRSEDNVLTLAAYGELGGLSGAIGRRAAAVYLALDDAAADATRRIFGRLVNLGEGTEDTRRRVLRSELGRDPAVDRSLAEFGVARLLSFDREPSTRAPTVEVAHEALIREWPRLRTWLEEDRDGLRILRHITETSAAWDERGRDDSELYRGGRLEGAVDWAAEHGDDLTPTEIAFLDASSDRATAEAEAEAEAGRELRRLLEAAQESEGRAQESARVAEQRSDEAESARRHADTSRLGWQAAFQAGSQRQLGLLMAIETARRDPGVGGLSALQRVLVGQDRYLGMLGAGNAYQGVEWLDDRTAVAYGTTGIEVFNVDTGASLRRLDTPVAFRQIRTGDGQKIIRPLVAVAADAGRLAYVSAIGNGQLEVIDLVELSTRTTVTLNQDADGLAISSDGRRLAVPLSEGTLELIDLGTGNRSRVLAHPGETRADQGLWDGVLSYSETYVAKGTDASYVLNTAPTNVHFVSHNEVVTVRGREVKFWDFDRGSPSRPPRNLWSTFELAPPERRQDVKIAVHALSSRLSSDSDLLASSASVFVRCDLATGQTNASAKFAETGEGFFAPKLVAMIEATDQAIWALTNRGTLFLVDVATGQAIGESFDAQTSGASDMALSPNRRAMLIAGQSGLALTSLAGDRLLARAIPREGLTAASVDAAGRYVARFDRSFARTPEVFEVESGDVVEFGGEVTAWFEKDGGVLLTMSFVAPGRLKITPWRDPKSAMSEGFTIDQMWEGSAMSPDRRLWAYGFETEAVVMSIETSTEIARTTVFDSASPTSLTFSPDSNRLALATLEKGFRLLEAPGWQPIDTPLDDLPIIFVKFSPDGRWLLDVAAGGVIELRDANTFEVVRTMVAPQGTGTAGGALFRQGGAIVEVNIGGLPQLWDVETGQPIGQPFPADPGLAGFHGAEGSELAITGIGDNFLLWNLNTDEWLDIASRAAGRNMTLEEWEQFGPAGEPYRATCPQWPALG